jgi:hypothetical protein
MSDSERPDAHITPYHWPEVQLLEQLRDERFPGFCVNLLIASRGYSDYLAETLPYTLSALHNLPGRRLIVSDFADEDTANVAWMFGCELLMTDAWTQEGATCNKGAVLNRGIETLGDDDPILILDADIALIPHHFQCFGPERFDAACIYGADRLLVHSPAEWDYTRLYEMPSRWPGLGEGGSRLPMDGRSHDSKGHYLPRGYFQLFHPIGADNRYPENRQDCDGSDIDFALQWKHFNRHLLTGVIVYHLQLDKQFPGVNWKGRVTPRFRG